MWPFSSKKKREDEIKDLLRNGDNTIMAAIAKSQDDLLDKFKVELKKVSADLQETQDRLVEINRTIENQKPIYSLKANIFARKRGNRLKLVARFNSVEALDKFFETIKGNSNQVMENDKTFNRQNTDKLNPC